jgi:hypothetical protein
MTMLSDRRRSYLLMATMALAGCGERAADPRGVGRDEVLVQIVASGRADTRPNEARFSAGVQTIGASAAEAGARNADKMNQVVSALRSLGVDPNDLRTQSITMRRIDYGPERGRFEANNLVEVRVRDVNRTGAAIGAATDAGANILSGPNLAVGDPEAAIRSAYAAAFRAARARADAYAEAAGLSVSRVLLISDAGRADPPRSYDANMSAQVSAPPRPEEAGPPVQVGAGTSEVRIRVDFALAR